MQYIAASRVVRAVQVGGAAGHETTQEGDIGRERSIERERGEGGGGTRGGETHHDSASIQLAR